MKTKLLLISAVEFEASATLEMLKAKGFEVTYAACGIGPIHAAKEEDRLAELADGKHVIFIGSCGCFYPFENVHMLKIARVLWMPPGERMALAQRPDHLHPPLELPVDEGLSLPAKTLLTSPSISLCADVGHEIGLPDKADLVENMELYSCIGGILKAASKVDVIMAVTNEIGADARQQWKEHFKEAGQLTAKCVVDYLSFLYRM